MWNNTPQCRLLMTLDETEPLKNSKSAAQGKSANVIGKHACSLPPWRYFGAELGGRAWGQVITFPNLTVILVSCTLVIVDATSN
jgi:hypothetical protein